MTECDWRLRYTKTGERKFSGFINNKPSQSFADTQYSISPTKILNLKPSAIVMGTLGLSGGPTKNLMESIVSSIITNNNNDNILLVIDINWREVFWNQDENKTKKQIIDFVYNNSDIIKLTDEEAVWLTGIDNKQLAFQRPDLVFNFLKPKFGILVSAGELGYYYYCNIIFNDNNNYYFIIKDHHIISLLLTISL